jgi:arylsulfatase A-like enzyme
MLTGLYGFREGVGILPPDAPLCIPTDVLTLPKLFKKAGYDTAVIGKWHLGLGATRSENGLERCGKAWTTGDRV